MSHSKFKIAGLLALALVLIAAIWFVVGLPRTFELRQLSQTDGMLVYADETEASGIYQRYTSFLAKAPLPDGARTFLLQHCEANTSSVVLRSLHPEISATELAKTEGMTIVNFLDLQLGADADAAIEQIVAKAPQLRILHLQGDISTDGLRTICKGLPDLEDLFLAGANFEQPVTELEDHLLKLQGMTLSECQLSREFNEGLEARPDIKIAIQ